MRVNNQAEEHPIPPLTLAHGDKENDVRGLIQEHFRSTLSPCNIRGQKSLGFFTGKVELMKLPYSSEVSDFDLTGPRRTLPDAALKDERLRYISTLSDRQILQLRQLSKEALETMSLGQLRAFFA